MPFLKCKLYEKPRSRVLQNLAHRQGLRHAINTNKKSVFVGQWKDSKKEGLGSMQMKSKKYYEGNWSGNYPNGFGIAAAKDVENVLVLEYRGNWEDGFYNGYGERHYPDHSYYKGYFRCNKRHGYGQYWMADGAFYDGDWANDVKHGLGMYVYPDGNRYEGGWKNDLKHGRGRYFHLHVGEMQEGVWVKDICVTSHLVYIPYYEICCCPGEYLMQLLELKDPDMVCKMAEDRALGEDSEDNLQESLDSSEKSLNTL